MIFMKKKKKIFMEMMNDVKKLSLNLDLGVLLYFLK